MRTKKILVVDDDVQMRTSISEILIRVGYNVSTACSGVEALSLMGNNSFEVVITDIRMPEMDGIQFLTEGKKTNPHSYFIMITAYGTREMAVDAIRKGAFDFIEKPFPAQILEAAVERAFIYMESQASQRGILTKSESTGPQQQQAPPIIGSSAEIKKILKLVEEIAKSNSTVLIQGKSGTGKELIAKLLHYKSPRRAKRLIGVNCAALPETLLESELFGYEKGAFTGASSSKPGKFKLADGGTILLDEISEMPLHLQAKLLRVIQEQEVDRIGGNLPVPIDVRIVATTNADIESAVRNGKFREDLYYRLNVIPIMLPPLAKRQSDIPALVTHFIQKFCTINGKKVLGVDDKAIKMLMDYDWPGNVRELENVIERAVVITKNEFLSCDDLFLHGCMMVEDLVADTQTSDRQFQPQIGASLAQIEKDVILKTLEKYNYNRTKTAGILGISVRTLRNKLKEYGVKPGNA